MKPIRPFVHETENFLRVLMDDEGIYELRALRSKRGTVTGYFNSPGKLASAAAEWSGQSAGVYLTMNPVESSLLARAANRTKEFAKHTTTDAEIDWRNWFLIDIDPQRPSGISATEQEHEAAEGLAIEIEKYLRNIGWSNPLVVDSGNGFQLLYRVNLPNDVNSTELLKSCLKGLSLLFSNDTVVVDEGTFNASRLVRIPGTINCKGDNTAERPHRHARLVTVPENLSHVGRKQLLALAQTNVEARKNVSEQPNFNVADWVQKHNLPVAYTAPWDGGQKWVLTRCPWHPEKHTDRAAFIVQLRNGAIAAGCHHNGCQGNDWHALRDLVEPNWKPHKEGQQVTVPGTLIEICKSGESFLDIHGDAYLAISDADVRRIWPVRSREFRNWLSRTYFHRTNKTPKAEALTSAINVIDAEAQSGGKRIELHNRYARTEDAIWIDMCDAKGRALKITESGWEIVNNPPVFCKRHPHQQSLPEPDRSGSLDDLDPFLNLTYPSDKFLTKVWVVTALVPDIPRPLLYFIGPYGSAKTTQAKLLKRIIDPSSAEALILQPNVMELTQSCDHHAVPLFDNVASLNRAQSNFFCCAVTGGGFSKRQLYTDSADHIFAFRRVIIMTGINEPNFFPDLLDRVLVVNTRTLNQNERKDERQLFKKFDQARPKILGGIVNALSRAMKIKRGLKIQNLPRMADFALWGTAVTVALGKNQQDFDDALKKNNRRKFDEIVERQPVVNQIVNLARTRKRWRGNASQLLSILRKKGRDDHDDRFSLSTPNHLTQQLRTLLPLLTENNVTVRFLPRKAERREIELKWEPRSS